MVMVGILGGGQVGALLANAVFDLGAQVSVYDLDYRAPLKARTSIAFTGGWDDETALVRFGDACTLIACEGSRISAAQLARVSELTGLDIYPNASSVERMGNRGSLLEWAQKCGMPMARFQILRDQIELRQSLAQLAFPAVVCPAVPSSLVRRGRQFHTRGELEMWLETLSDSMCERWFPCVLEQVIRPLVRLSCAAARSQKGESVVFPVAELLGPADGRESVLFPSRLDETILVSVRDATKRLIDSFDVVGVMVSEWWVGYPERGRSKGKGEEEEEVFLYLVDASPFPETSWATTRRVLSMSLFDAWARCLLDVPLSQPEMLGARSVLSVPILGEALFAQGNPDLLDLAVLSRYPEVLDVVRFGAVPSRSDEEIGRFALVGDHVPTILDRAEDLQQALRRGNAIAHSQVAVTDRERFS